jgi:hypothetical protein
MKRKPLIFTLVSFIAFFIVIIIFDRKGNKASAYISSTFIDPPIARAHVPFTTYLLDADSGYQVKYPSGTLIHIPTGAFVDSAGQSVSGKVNLNYREFHKPSEIYLSGIPMLYDSMGQVYVFESAGMLQIDASQNGKPLYANRNKPIRVDMVADTDRLGYPAYYLDTLLKKWVGVARPLVVTTAKADSATLYDDIDTASDQTTDLEKVLQNEKPVPVFIANKEKAKFHIEVSENEFPELAGYNGLRFQAKGQDDFDPKFSEITWSNIKLQKLNDTEYQVTLVSGKKSFEIIAIPVVDDQNMAEAQKLYDKKYKDYIAKLDQRKTEQERAKTTKDGRSKLWTKDMQNKFVAACQSHLIYSYFNILKFGVYNSDCPKKWPSEVDVVAHITDYWGHNLSLCDMCLVQRGLNSVYIYHFRGSQYSGFKFNRSAQNTMWATTTDGKIAIIDSASFKAQQQSIKDGQIYLQFKVMDKEIGSYQDVRKYLDS